MKLYINTEGLLVIDNDILSAKYPLLFIKLNDTQFNITSPEGFSILPEVVDMSTIRVENSLGVAYANTDAVYAAIYSAFQSSSVITSGTGTTLEPSDRIVSTELTITRPANTTVYSAGDVIGDVSGSMLKWLNVAMAAGKGVRIDNISARTNDTGLAGKRLDIHIYREAVASPIADNAAMNMADADASKSKGILSITFGTGTRGKVAMDMFTNLELNPVSRDVYCEVETVEGFTPSANSTWIILKLSCTITN